MDAKSTIARTPAVNCPDCRQKTRHRASTSEAYHPLTGHGYTKETGWTHPDLEPQK